MADIYTQRAVSQIANPISVEGDAAPLLNAASDFLSKSAKKDFAEAQDIEERKVRQAEELYFAQLNYTAMQGMQDLYEKHQNDPVKLENELQTLGLKIQGTIEDEETQLKFATNYLLRSSSFINNAKNNFKNAENKKYVSSIYNSIYANQDMMSLSLTNALTGAATQDDIINFGASLKMMSDGIEAKRDDGTYIFSDSERRTMRSNADKAVLQGFENAWANMTPEQQNALEESVNNGVLPIQFQTKDGVETRDIKNDIPANLWTDIKGFVQNEGYKRRTREIQERDLEGKIALKNFWDNPTKENFDAALAANPAMSDKLVGVMEDYMAKKKNLLAKTSYNGITQTSNAAKKLASMDTSSPKGQEAFRVEQANVINAIAKLNYDGELSPEMRDTLIKAVAQIQFDKTLKNALSNLESIHTNSGFLPEQIRNYALEQTAKDFSQWYIMGAIGGDVAQQAKQEMAVRYPNQFKYYSMDKLQGSDLTEAIMKLAKRQMLADKYRDLIPGIQNAYKWKEGMPIMINGKAYKFAGESLDGDLLVEFEYGK